MICAEEIGYEYEIQENTSIDRIRNEYREMKEAELKAKNVSSTLGDMIDFGALMAQLA